MSITLVFLGMFKLQLQPLPPLREGWVELFLSPDRRKACHRQLLVALGLLIRLLQCKGKARRLADGGCGRSEAQVG